MHRPEAPSPLTRATTLFLASICGLTTANVYYAQPVLDLIAQGFGTDSATAASLVTTGQIGTAIGLLLVVPAADLVRRKPVLAGLFLIDAVALGGMALAPGITVLAGLSSLVGLAAVANPIILAYSAGLTTDRERARVLGTIMSGVLLGILLSRTVSSLLAQVGGWRLVYLTSAAVMVIVTVLVVRILPDSPAASSVPYRAQLVALVTQFRDHPVLRSRCLIGGCVMATFTGFWTSVAFLLSGPPFFFGQIAIGLFALSGVAGALTTSFGGRVLDRRRDRRWETTGVGIAVLALSFAMLAAGGSELWLLIVGAVVMDAALQAVHITNQSVVYELDPAARSRLAAGYMAGFAIGGAIGSTAFALAYSWVGWGAACATGAGFAVAALVVWATTGGAERRRQREDREHGRALP